MSRDREVRRLYIVIIFLVWAGIVCLSLEITSECDCECSPATNPIYAMPRSEVEFPPWLKEHWGIPRSEVEKFPPWLKEYWGIDKEKK